ncbi:MAG TPA: diaminopimelate dehydrogenase [Clostridia bacterium]|nr:diaminopimelate dehydrogenase [Clostridia bacterium]
MDKIKVGILGYGNLGRGVELAVSKAEDMELVAVFTRRDNVVTNMGIKCINVNKIEEYKDRIDVLIMCGGSATDLPVQGVQMIKNFNTVDSFDTHAKIPEYFANMDKVAKQNGKLGIISVGWDPGLFSMARMLFGAVLPDGNDYTFWGKGVSQGHSDAIRRVNGVKAGIQYTIPKDEALKKVRNAENPVLSAREKHLRECFVVLEDGADKAKVESEIKNMPNYFADYDTIVHFVSEQELKQNHNKMPHGGFVIRSGNTTDEHKHVLELSIKLDSNPEFTSSVLTAYARAIAKLAKEGKTGAVTVFDIPLSYLSSKSPEDLRKNLL